MTERKPANILEIAVLAIAIGIAAILIAPVAGKSPDARKDRTVSTNAEIINLAIRDYSTKNRGSFPETQKVAGGGIKDELIRGSILIKYPRNPYSSSGERMKNVPEESWSPGNFTYIRNPKITNSYTITAYGKNGVVYRRHYDIMK